MIHVQIETSDEFAPLGVVEALTRNILVLIDEAGLVVVTLVENFLSVVCPLVILIVIIVIFDLYGLFVRLFEWRNRLDRLGRLNWLDSHSWLILLG